MRGLGVFGATVLALMLVSQSAWAQYNLSAGSNAPRPAKRSVRVMDKDTGKMRMEEREVEVKRDSHGNASGSTYDLAIDGAFEGQTVVVLQLHRTTIEEPWEVLRQKGFSVYRFQGVPTTKQLAEALGKANQFWLIAGCQGQELEQEHANLIKKFFDSGHGVYIWGDNDPCYADANLVARTLFDSGMTGDTPGDQTIEIKTAKTTSGVLENHLLSTGIENIYEGVTIATIDKNRLLQPFIWGSAGNVVASLHDKGGKRAILDGGFTRLYYKWNTAGTGRYIANAGAWLANVERFGDEVVADKFKDAASEKAVKGAKSK